MIHIRRVTDRTVVALIVCTLAQSVCYPQSKNVFQDEPVFRPPFVLKLHLDREHYYEENFNKVPYVADNDKYLFAGDNFGINITIKSNRVSRIGGWPTLF